MPIYHCECCKYQTYIKTHFTKHLQTKKHLRLINSQPKTPKSQPKVNMESTSSQPFSENITNNIVSDITPFQCKYCQKYFKFKQSMYKHIKYTCKKNDDEDFKELARLLNEQKNEVRNMQKQIDKLTQKLQIQNVNNGMVNNGTVNNNTINMNMEIKLLNHADTDYSHLTPKDYIMCINECNYCVKTLIEKLHFNQDKPENMNIYISNIKGNYMMIYKDNEWQICKRKEKIDDLYEYNEIILENWYDEYKEKYPHIIKSFQRYLHNKDENDMLNKVKDEILMMLYNKRREIVPEG